MNSTFYPMQLSGGAFLICVGIAMVIGALAGPPYIGWFITAGLVLGFATILLTIPASRARRGAPSAVHMRFMWVAIFFELIAFTALPLLGLYRGHSLLFAFQVALAIVALHFIIMRWSHGPLMGWLASALLIWIGLAALVQLPIPQLVLGDGLLKLAFGLLMAAPLFKPLPSAAPSR